MISSVFLMGRLTRNADISTTKNGKQFVITTIAADDGGQLVNDKWETNTQFLPVIFWGKLAETLNKYFKKGDAILIEGHIKYENKKDESGNFKEHFLINAIKINFLPNMNKTSKNTEADSEISKINVKETAKEKEQEMVTADWGDDDILWS